MLGARVSRMVVDDPEDSPGGGVGLLHHLVDEPVEGFHPTLRLGATEHTNEHDNEQINRIYRAHDDPTSTSTSTSATGTGKVRRVRKDLYVETFPIGDKLFTFVTFTNDAAAARAPRDGVPE